MRHSGLGGSGVEVSVVGLGGYWLGGADVSAAVEVLEASVAAGVDWIDTAEAYFDGANETLLGTALRGFPEVLVASKIWPAATPATAEGVRSACTASLQRLGRDVLDVYFVHAPAPDVPLEETWTAMADLVTDGLVRAIGLSNHPLAQVRQAHALRPVDVVQDGLSLLDHLQLREHFAGCAAQGIAGVGYEPLANGLLTGAMRPDTDLTEQREWPAIFQRLFAPGRFERSLDVVGRLRVLAADWGCSVAQLAIAWCAHQTGVSAVLAGTTSPAHASSNAAAGALALDASRLQQLDALIPLGPAFG